MIDFSDWSNERLARDRAYRQHVIQEGSSQVYDKAQEQGVLDAIELEIARRTNQTASLEMLIAPIEDEAHHKRVCENLQYARRVGDTFAIYLLMAQLAHSQSWRPQSPNKPNTD